MRLRLTMCNARSVLWKLKSNVMILLRNFVMLFRNQLQNTGMKRSVTLPLSVNAAPLMNKNALQPQLRSVALSQRGNATLLTVRRSAGMNPERSVGMSLERSAGTNQDRAANRFLRRSAGMNLRRNVILSRFLILIMRMMKNVLPLTSLYAVKFLLTNAMKFLSQL